MSGSRIMEGNNLPDLILPRITFGSYAIVYLKTTNTMKHSSVPGISLWHQNDHGRHYFKSIYTGKRINSNKLIEIPIDDEVVGRVKELGKSYKQITMTDVYPILKRRPGEEVGNDNEDCYDNYGYNEVKEAPNNDINEHNINDDIETTEEKIDKQRNEDDSDIQEDNEQENDEEYNTVPIVTTKVAILYA